MAISKTRDGSFRYPLKIPNPFFQSCHLQDNCRELASRWHKTGLGINMTGSASLVGVGQSAVTSRSVSAGATCSHVNPV
jgi:hypothetical protein